MSGFKSVKLKKIVQTLEEACKDKEQDDEKEGTADSKNFGNQVQRFILMRQLRNMKDILSDEGDETGLNNKLNDQARTVLM